MTVYEYMIDIADRRSKIYQLVSTTYDNLCEKTEYGLNETPEALEFANQPIEDFKSNLVLN